MAEVKALFMVDTDAVFQPAKAKRIDNAMCGANKVHVLHMLVLEVLSYAALRESSDNAHASPNSRPRTYRHQGT